MFGTASQDLDDGQNAGAPGPSNDGDWFGASQSSVDIEQVKASGIPYKTKAYTSWTMTIWCKWAIHCSRNLLNDEAANELLHDVVRMESEAMAYWLKRFILEVQKADGECYSPDSLYQICCGLHQAMRSANHEISIFEQSAFQQFRMVLDGELKSMCTKREPTLLRKRWKRLWEKVLLGDHSPQALSDTVVYLIGLFFALRSGEEHRRLRYRPSQITLIQPPSGKPYLHYKQDISKTNQAGLKQRKLIPKEFVHYCNEENSSWCLVRLYQLYNSLCPPDRPDDAFYLTPLVCPKKCWFKKVALGHNKLANVVPRLMKSAGIKGYFTNHSLHATATTRMYEADVDEATIMEHTGHWSVDGLRSYKRESLKLNEVTSNVLNRYKRTKTEDVPQPKSTPSTSKENTSKAIESVMPAMNLHNANNFSINFTFGQWLCN